MPHRQPLRVAVFFLIGLFWSASGGAQGLKMTEDSEVLAQQWRDLSLTNDSEVAFQRFIFMAQTGQLGNEVTNANAALLKNHVRVELSGPGGLRKELLLTPRTSHAEGAFSRYFDIEAGEGATASDVVRVGRALDTAFSEDPFRHAYDFFNASPGADPIPRLADAWEYAGWSGVLRVFERQMAALAGVRYTIAVIVALAAAMLGSLIVLWGSSPQRPTVESSTPLSGNRAATQSHTHS